MDARAVLSVALRELRVATTVMVRLIRTSCVTGTKLEANQAQAHVHRPVIHSRVGECPNAGVVRSEQPHRM